MCVQRAGGTRGALEKRRKRDSLWKTNERMAAGRGLALIQNRRSMKRVLSILLVTLILAFSAGPVSSQTVRRHRRHSRTFWQKHRDKLTVAGTTAAGAGIGAIAGRGKGAAIGAAAGAGTGALYTYKLRKRHRHRRRY